METTAIAIVVSCPLTLESPRLALSFSTAPPNPRLRQYNTLTVSIDHVFSKPSISCIARRPRQCPKHINSSSPRTASARSYLSLHQLRRVPKQPLHVPRPARNSPGHPDHRRQLHWPKTSRSRSHPCKHPDRNITTDTSIQAKSSISAPTGASRIRRLVFLAPTRATISARTMARISSFRRPGLRSLEADCS